MTIPWWTVAPFVVLLVGIAVLPLAAGHWWERNRNKLLFALACGLPVAAWLCWQAALHEIPLTLHDHPVLAAGHEYLQFMLVLFALFVISGGVLLKGTLPGTPAVNTAILLVGALLGSFVGTTGASMLLIRPLLRANTLRKRKTHLVVFFIFVVSNCGGLLTPLGDPPLFLGFLRGVPFLWTLGLWQHWAVVNGALLVIFHFLDSWCFHREDVAETGVDLDEAVEAAREPLGFAGGFNLLLLAGVIGVIGGAGHYGWPVGVPELLMLGLALASIVTTPRAIRAANRFTYAPIVEVACLFLGIFLAMVPALRLLNAHAGELGIETPRQFFWVSGLLSSFLDNAPTYLTFAAVAAGLENVVAEGRYLAEYLALGDAAHRTLEAIACGAVFMGANTYIGNGPNFMVKAIAESGGVKMPSFFGYMGWSVAVLVPLFTVVSLVLF